VGDLGFLMSEFKRKVRKGGAKGRKGFGASTLFHPIACLGFWAFAFDLLLTSPQR
jgi:hypothetical protein